MRIIIERTILIALFGILAFALSCNHDRTPASIKRDIVCPPDSKKKKICSHLTCVEVCNTPDKKRGE